jgi:hypothetical protein
MMALTMPRRSRRECGSPMQLHGHGVGRSKKEAEQQAAESAYSNCAKTQPTPHVSRLASLLSMPELPEVEVVRRGLDADVVGPHDHPS